MHELADRYINRTQSLVGLIVDDLTSEAGMHSLSFMLWINVIVSKSNCLDGHCTLSPEDHANKTKRPLLGNELEHHQEGVNPLLLGNPFADLQ